MPDIRDIVKTFTQQIADAIETQILERARSAIGAALGSGSAPRGRRGRPAKALSAGRTAGRPRRKAPKQLCPVPGCKNPAAPVFGMVCANHKDVPKTKIKQYREARRAKKQGGGGGRSASRGARKRKTRPRRAKAAVKTRAKAKVKTKVRNKAKPRGKSKAKPRAKSKPKSKPKKSVARRKAKPRPAPSPAPAPATTAIASPA
jgi:hypothetical protein